MLLRKNDVTILREMRRELESMRERLHATTQEGINGRDGTAQRSIAQMLMGHASFLCDALMSFEMFLGHCQSSIEMMDIMRRIMEGTTEWEALMTKPQPVYEPPRFVIGVDWGKDSVPSLIRYTGHETPIMSFYPHSILKLVDEEIEESILAPGLVRSYKAGTRVICGYCKQGVELTHDGRLPSHDDPKLDGKYKFCAGSHMAFDIEGNTYPPGDSGKRHGFCSLCGETQEVKEGLIVSHETKAGFECGGSGKKGVPASEAIRLQSPVTTPEGTFIAVACPSGSPANMLADIAKKYGIGNEVEYQNSWGQGSVMTFRVPSSVFSIVMLDNFIREAKSSLGLELKPYYGDTRSEAYQNAILANSQASGPQPPPSEEHE